MLTLKAPKTKIFKNANSADPDEVAHDEPPHLGLGCWPYSLNMIYMGRNIFFLILADVNFVYYFGALRVKICPRTYANPTREYTCSVWSGYAISFKVNGYTFRGSNSVLFIFASLLNKGQCFKKRICSLGLAP